MLAVLSTARDTLHTNICSILKIKNESFHGTCTFLPFHLSSITHLLTGGNDFSCQGRGKMHQTREEKKKDSLVNQRKQFLRYKVSAEMSFYCHIPVTLFKKE